MWKEGVLIKHFPPESYTIKNIDDAFAFLKTEDGQKRSVMMMMMIKMMMLMMMMMMMEIKMMMENMIENMIEIMMKIMMEL